MILPVSSGWLKSQSAALSILPLVHFNAFTHWGLVKPKLINCSTLPSSGTNDEVELFPVTEAPATASLEYKWYNEHKVSCKAICQVMAYNNEIWRDINNVFLLINTSGLQKESWNLDHHYVLTPSSLLLQHQHFWYGTLLFSGSSCADSSTHCGIELPAPPQQ